MESNPRGDSVEIAPRPEQEWHEVLTHRSPGTPGFDEVINRLASSDITPDQLRAVLSDGGDALYSAVVSGRADWADAFGGPLVVALLAAEVGALAAHLNSRASAVRSVAVDVLLNDYSAVTVAAEIGVSRQKVYEIARNGLRQPYINTVPWRKP